LGFLPNHAYQNAPRFNAYRQPEADGFGYKTLPQFPFRPHPIDMTPTRAMAEPGANPNNLTNQLAGGFGYETLPQFPFRPHPIDMTPTRAMAEPGMDPNNLTNQLATILRESFNIEPKG
jgi:hypothetical protein